MAAQSNLPAVYQFGTRDIRVIDKDGEMWFVADDITAALDLHRTAHRRLDDDEKGVHSTHTPGGEQEAVVINESGLYSLVLSSRKAEAKAFKRWVTHEVLPSIRKKGGYGQPDPERIELAHALASQAMAQVAQTVFNAVMSGENEWWRHNRYLLALTYGRDNKPSVPWAKALSHDQVIASVDEWPKLIAGPDGVSTNDVQLADIGMAVATKQAARAKRAAEAKAAAKQAEQSQITFAARPSGRFL